MSAIKNQTQNTKHKKKTQKKHTAARLEKATDLSGGGSTLVKLEHECLCCTLVAVHQLGGGNNIPQRLVQPTKRMRRDHLLGGKINIV
jgi:hypothetical protein